MTILISLVIWYLIGIISFLLYSALEFGKISLSYAIMSVFVGILGPVGTIICLANYSKYDEIILWKKK